jgi:hypothetical protein
MNWWGGIILAVISWLIGILLLKNGLTITKGNFRKKSVEEQAENLTFMGNGLIWYIFSSVIVWALKNSPWWIIRLLIILFAFGFLYLGTWAITTI